MWNWRTVLHHSLAKAAAEWMEPNYRSVWIWKWQGTVCTHQWPQTKSCNLCFSCYSCIPEFQWLEEHKAWQGVFEPMLTLTHLQSAITIPNILQPLLIAFVESATQSTKDPAFHCGQGRMFIDGGNEPSPQFKVAQINEESEIWTSTRKLQKYLQNKNYYDYLSLSVKTQCNIVFALTNTK